uniref:BolA-like protein n=1 Tax=Timema cristinae TaxID=61476 RepID=A0A7R9CGV3_TIMCR|nr:unnamed protein product [Timema cristinae]
MSTVCESVAHDVSKPVESIIRHKLTSCLNPVHLEVINESYMHNAPKGSESHFKVVVVSEKFESLPLIKFVNALDLLNSTAEDGEIERHRLVNEALQQELQTSIHALSISYQNYNLPASCEARQNLPPRQRVVCALHWCFGQKDLLSTLADVMERPANPSLIDGAKTPTQWAESSQVIEPSPACRGGFGK